MSEYVFFNGVRIARQSVTAINTCPSMLQATPSFYLADNLGSSRVITNATGHILDDVDFYPFGGERDANSSSSGDNYKFTGKERDSESGLDNFGARYNSSSMGRFITPDPLYLESHRLVDPQQLNLYSYVRNNPLSLTDPNGLDITCTGDRCKDYLAALQKDVSFKVKYDDKGKVVADVDKGVKLSKSNKAFLKAIDDTKNHVTINAVGGENDSSVFFGASHGSINPHNQLRLGSATRQLQERRGHDICGPGRSRDVGRLRRS